MPDKTYEDGVQEGRLKSLEDSRDNHKGRLDHHSNRLRITERCIWALGGALVLVTFIPKIQGLMGV